MNFRARTFGLLDPDLESSRLGRILFEPHLSTEIRSKEKNFEVIINIRGRMFRRSSTLVIQVGSGKEVEILN